MQERRHFSQQSTFFIMSLPVKKNIDRFPQNQV